ncbi:glycosyltransferase [Leptothoe sp. PORK10 BA2]|uniref:glycosyltransferase n=1 Tax=Leptothoe sp. PORK10 BA2 TaxID=3110254 RepID=UPI002B1EFEC4|nr:glycosyltransferase [Leptothoe sp. PORK10 BA2]MEA5464687.1 glycosyltransferase [Leptothoe sp. PORK10 BA2]
MDNPKNTTQNVDSLPLLERSNLPRVSIIIPVHNGAKSLATLLNALQKQTYPSYRLEIIVADNNSHDGSDQLASSFTGVQIVYEHKIQNAGAARNRAMQSATGEIFAFTDADCVPNPDWVEQGVKYLTQWGCDRIAGSVIFSPLSAKSSSAAILDAVYNLNQQFLVETFQSAVTANLFAHRKVFETVGFFHTDYFEDMQWNRRASMAGFSIQYGSKSIVSHPPRDVFSSVWEKGRRSGRGVFALCQSEQRGGWLGSRHILRMGRMLLVPRPLHWERLPFAINSLSRQKRLKIELLKWLAINVAEIWGYLQWWLRALNQPSECLDESSSRQQT